MVRIGLLGRVGVGRLRTPHQWWQWWHSGSGCHIVDRWSLILHLELLRVMSFGFCITGWCVSWRTGIKILIGRVLLLQQPSEQPVAAVCRTVTQKPPSFHILLTRTIRANLAFKLASVLPMPFICIGLCKREFANQAGLSRHQNSCEAYQTSQALKIERRRAVFHRTKALGGLDARKARIDSRPHVCPNPNL